MAVTTPVLFCSDPLRPGRVDENLVAEARAVRAAGGALGLVDYDALLCGDLSAAVRRVPPGLGPAWYRGWMMPDNRYRELAENLTERGAGLLVPPEDQLRAHQLPGWYPTFAELTPASVWIPSEPRVIPSRDEIATLVAPLGGGPGVVKDFVKSRKHDWHDACFIPDLTDIAAVYRVVRRFVELQHVALAGGLVVRAFEPFVTAGSHCGEARVWWLDAEPVLTGAHPDTREQRPRPDLTRVRSLVAALGCRFVTTDLALRTDGVWRLVELGDGQVSALPAGTHPSRLMIALLNAHPAPLWPAHTRGGARPARPAV